MGRHVFSRPHVSLRARLPNPALQSGASSRVPVLSRFLLAPFPPDTTALLRSFHFFRGCVLPSTTPSLFSWRPPDASSWVLCHLLMNRSASPSALVYHPPMYSGTQRWSSTSPSSRAPTLHSGAHSRVPAPDASPALPPPLPTRQFSVACRPPCAWCGPRTAVYIFAKRP